MLGNETRTIPIEGFRFAKLQGDSSVRGLRACGNLGSVSSAFRLSTGIGKDTTIFNTGH